MTPGTSGSKTGHIGRRLFPPKNDGKTDEQTGWRLDWKGVRESNGAPMLTLEIQPNKDAKMQQLRRLARRSHTTLALLRVPLDHQKKLPEKMDVASLFKFVVNKQDVREAKEISEWEAGVMKGNQEEKGTKRNIKRGGKK